MLLRTSLSQSRIIVPSMAITVPLTIVALMNAMIGGTILILPLIFLQAGIIPSLVSCIIMGLVN